MQRTIKPKQAAEGKTLDEQIVEEHGTAPSREPVKTITADPKTLTSAGATVYNMALGGGHQWGKIVNLVGDNSTGKTLLCCEVIAHARQRLGKKLKWFYDDAEAGFSFPTKEMYGFDIVAPDDECSFTVNDFRSRLDKKLDSLKDDEYFIYVLDSFDALTTEAEVKHSNKKQKAIEEGDDKAKGSYGTSKAKEQSEFFRLMRHKIKHHNCLLIVVSQVRENIGVMFGAKYTRAGGKALDFYASQIIWLAVAEKKNISGRVAGICIKARITKNKIGKPYRDCYIEILFDYGVDDILSSLVFLYGLKTDGGKDKEKIK